LVQKLSNKRKKMMLTKMMMFSAVLTIASSCAASDRNKSPRAVCKSDSDFLAVMRERAMSDGTTVVVLPNADQIQSVLGSYFKLSDRNKIVEQLADQQYNREQVIRVIIDVMRPDGLEGRFDLKWHNFAANIVGWKFPRR
jgi:hypothetical protein